MHHVHEESPCVALVQYKFGTRGPKQVSGMGMPPPFFRLLYRISYFVFLMTFPHTCYGGSSHRISAHGRLIGCNRGPVVVGWTHSRGSRDRYCSEGSFIKIHLISRSCFWPDSAFTVQKKVASNTVILLHYNTDLCSFFCATVPYRLLRGRRIQP